jgi:hypothetical protein
MTDEQKPRPDEGDGPLLTDDRSEKVAGSGPRRWSRRLTTFAVACGLVIGAAALTLEVEEQRDRDQRSLIIAEQERLDRIETVLTAPDAVSRSTKAESGLRLSAVYSSEHHAAVVTYADMPDIPEERTYQLWRVRNNRTKSMRVLAPDAREGSAMVLDLDDGDAVALTVEPEGGSGQPTGDIVVGLPLN